MYLHTAVLLCLATQCIAEWTSSLPAEQWVPVSCCARYAGTLSSVGMHTDDAFTAFTPWDGYSKNITYRNGRCPARVFMDDILHRLQTKFWGDPFPGHKIVSHRVSMWDEKAVRDVYNKFENRLENCTKVLLLA